MGYSDFILHVWTVFSPCTTAKDCSKNIQDEFDYLEGTGFTWRTLSWLKPHKTNKPSWKAPWCGDADRIKYKA